MKLKIDERKCYQCDGTNPECLTPGEVNCFYPFPECKLDTLFDQQKQFQSILGEKDLPKDLPDKVGYHLLGLFTEIGEVAATDTRWKNNGRNKINDQRNKLEELADCFIFLINICLFSGFDYRDIFEAVVEKIGKNKARYKK